jgi:nucleoside-diphosphate-sugar epimerase
LLQPIHIDDLAVSFRLALEHPVSIGEIYNITLDHAVTLNRYIELNAEALGKKAHINYVPLEEMCKKYAGEINDTWLRFFATHMCFTNEKARRELGFVPTHTPEEAIIETARAFGSNLK